MDMKGLRKYVDGMGTIFYFLKCPGRILHCEYGPAVEYKNGHKFWYYNNRLHRVGGPAVEYNDGKKEYWLGGHMYSDDDYNKMMSNTPLLYWKRFKSGGWLGGK
jgi:hypothetical protein